jgi:hypothetical protein
MSSSDSWSLMALQHSRAEQATPDEDHPEPGCLTNQYQPSPFVL